MRTNKEKYQAAFRVLHTSVESEMEELMQNDMNQRRKGWMHVNHAVARLAAAACALVLCTGVVFAAVHFLTPAEIAHEVGDMKLEEALSSEDAIDINETQSFGDYNVTLLGMVSGKDISNQKVEANQGEFRDDRSYIVVAIERKDGENIGWAPEDSFFVTPLIDGYDQSEVNIATLIGGYTETVSDDGKVRYHIADMDNIECFADHKIHLGVQNGGFFEESPEGETAFIYDEKTGSYSRNKAFDGVNALFDLPIDPSRADPDKAKELLAYHGENEDADYSVDVLKITRDNLNNLAEPVQGASETIAPENDKIQYSIAMDDGSTEERTCTFSSLFPDKKPGMSESFQVTQSDSGTYVTAYILTDDGTVRVEVYKVK